MRFLLMGDLSQGTSTDRAQDLDARQIRLLDGSNLNAVIKDMGMEVKLEVPNRVDGDGSLDVSIPVESMKSFDPLHVAQAVPKLEGLLLVKKLLLEEHRQHSTTGRRFAAWFRLLPKTPKQLQPSKSLKGHAGFEVPTLAETSDEDES